MKLNGMIWGKQRKKKSMDGKCKESKECYKDVKLMYIITAAIGLLYLIIIIIYYIYQVLKRRKKVKKE